MPTGRNFTFELCLPTDKDTMRLKSYPAVVVSNNIDRMLPLGQAPEKVQASAWFPSVVGQENQKSATSLSLSSASSAAVSADGAVSSGIVEEKRNNAAKSISHEKIPDLMHFVHGKQGGILTLTAAFHAEHPEYSKAQIEKQIKEISSRERHELGHGTPRWVVKRSVMESYNIQVNILI
jgi:hypothetical protein